MKIRIEKTDDIGFIIRSVRKHQKIRQDDAAGFMGVSENFLGKVENGGDTVQWGKLFTVLQSLGIELYADITEESMQTLESESIQRWKSNKRARSE